MDLSVSSPPALPVPAADARPPSPTVLGKRKALSSTLGLGRIALDAAEEHEIRRKREKVKGLVNPVDPKTGVFKPDLDDNMEVVQSPWSGTIGSRIALTYKRMHMDQTRLEGANRCNRCIRLESKTATTGAIRRRPDFGCSFWAKPDGSITLLNCTECYIMGKSCVFGFAQNMKTLSRLEVVELALKRQSRQGLSAAELAAVLTRERAEGLAMVDGHGVDQVGGRTRERLPHDGASDASTIREAEKAEGGENPLRAGSKGKETSRAEEHDTGGPFTPTVNGFCVAIMPDREAHGKPSEIVAGAGLYDGTSDGRDGRRRSSTGLATHGPAAEDESERNDDPASEGSVAGNAGGFGDDSGGEDALHCEQGGLSAGGIRDDGARADDPFSTGFAARGLLALSGGPGHRSTRKAVAAASSSLRGGSNGGSPLQSEGASQLPHRDLALSPSRTADSAMSTSGKEKVWDSRSSSRNPPEKFMLSTPGKHTAWKELDEYLKGDDQPLERYGATIEEFEAVLSGLQNEVFALAQMLNPLRWNKPARGTAEDIKACTQRLRSQRDGWARKYRKSRDKDTVKGNALTDVQVGWLSWRQLVDEMVDI